MDRFPFPPRGKGRPAPSHQPGIHDFANDPLGTDVDGPTQGLVAPLGQVVLQAVRLQAADPAQQAQSRLTLLGDAEGGWNGGRLRLAFRLVRHRQEGIGRGWRQSAFPGPGAGRRDQGGRGAFAQAEAGTPEPGEPGRGLSRSGRTQAARQALADGRGSPDQAGDVVTQVNDGPRPSSHGEEPVEIGNAEGFGGREAQPAAGVVQGSGADPAEAAVDGVENRKQQVPLRPLRPLLLEMKAFRLPRLEGTQDAVDGGLLVPVRRLTRNVKIQR